MDCACNECSHRLPRPGSWSKHWWHKTWGLGIFRWCKTIYHMAGWETQLLLLACWWNFGYGHSALLLLQRALVIQIGKRVHFLKMLRRGEYFHINIEQIVQQEWIVAGVGWCTDLWHSLILLSQITVITPYLIQSPRMDPGNSTCFRTNESFLQ